MSRREAPSRPSVPVVQFLGGAGTVTGSRFLVDTPRARVLVDCGLFQGPKDLRLRNWAPFPVPPASIDAVVLTHAHVDHAGWLPALVRDGFAGSVFATKRSGDLCRIVLPDSARLLEEEAAYANRRGFSKHDPALAMFSGEDVAQALDRFRDVPFDHDVDVAEGVAVRWLPAGHILGSASVLLSIGGNAPRRVLVSGDLGRAVHPILVPPTPPPEADLVLVESTYGDRVHDEDASLTRLRDALVRSAATGGIALIPAFAVDRTEVLLIALKQLMASGAVPRLPVYVDSPMALDALSVYRDAIAAGDRDVRRDRHGDDDLFDPGDLHEARDPQASRAINRVAGPAIVISASGMATGGRVLHHLAHRLPDARNSVILVGYQAVQTRGRLLLGGAKSVKMLGRYIPVRAQIVDASGFSVHADRDELLAWLRSAPREPEACFVVHGDPEASSALHDGIERELGWTAVVPSQLERVRVDAPSLNGATA